MCFDAKKQFFLLGRKFADSHSQNGASRQNGTGSVHERTLQDVPSPRKSLKQQKTTLWSNPDPAFDRAISLLAPLRQALNPKPLRQALIPYSWNVASSLLFPVAGLVKCVA